MEQIKDLKNRLVGSKFKLEQRFNVRLQYDGGDVESLRRQLQALRSERESLEKIRSNQENGLTRIAGYSDAHEELQGLKAKHAQLKNENKHLL